MLGWQHWKSFSKQDKPKPKLQNKLCKSSAWTSDGRTLPEQPPILSWLLFAQLKAFGRWNQITVWYSNIVMEHKQFLKGKHSAAIGVGTLWESPQVFYWTHRCMVERLIDWLIDWLSDWLIDWLTDWLPEWLTEWMRPNCRHLVPRTQWWFSAIAWVSVGYISVVWGCLGCTFINYHRLWCQGIGMRSSPIGSKVFVDLATRLRRSKTKFARQIFGYLYIIFMTYNHPYVVCTNTKLPPQTCRHITPTTSRILARSSILRLWVMLVPGVSHQPPTMGEKPWPILDTPKKTIVGDSPIAEKKHRGLCTKIDEDHVGFGCT